MTRSILNHGYYVKVWARAGDPEPLYIGPMLPANWSLISIADHALHTATQMRGGAYQLWREMPGRHCRSIGCLMVLAQAQELKS